jgi:energy-coupling factor transporter ATP-binding protein EcfA2
MPAKKAAPSGPEHILKDLQLPDRYERLVERLGHEVVQVLVPPPTPTADVIERCALAIRTRDEGLFIPVYGPSGAGKTTLAYSLTHFFPPVYAPTALHDGKVTYDALTETADKALRDRKANDRRILPISIDNRESDPPTPAELAAIKRFLRNAKIPVRPLIIWLDTGKENCQDMSRRFEGIAGLPPVVLPLVFEGPDRSVWQDVATNTLRLVNSVDSLEELGVNPRDYDPGSFHSLGDFLRSISGDFDDKRFKLLRETKRPISLIVVFASESQEPGILTQLTSTSRYGLVDGHALVGVTPDSELGKWWSTRRGLLTRAIVQLNVHAFCLPPGAAIGVLRRYGPEKTRKLLDGNGVRQPGTSRLNRDLERSDLGKYLAGEPIRAYEARGTPAKLSVKAFAAVAKEGLAYGKDRGLNDGFALAMADYLKYREMKYDKVTAEKQLSFCGLIPDNAVYTESGVQCIEYHWRKGEFLVSPNRSAVASYVLRKVRDYVRQLEWTKD